MSSKLCPQSAPSQLGGVAFRSCPSSSSAMSFYVEAASSTTRLLWPIDSGVVPSGCGGRRGVASERRLPASYRDSAPPYIFDILMLVPLRLRSMRVMIPSVFVVEQRRSLYQSEDIISPANRVPMIPGYFQKTISVHQISTQIS